MSAVPACRLLPDGGLKRNAVGAIAADLFGTMAAHATIELGRRLTTMNKRALIERDICTKFITPALRRAGWDEMVQIREEVGFTKGRIIVRGKLVSRDQAKRADYIRYFKPNIPLALIEAKDNTHGVGDGHLTPLAEQHRIVAKVDELMALCDRLEASLTTGEATRRRLLYALLVEALVPVYAGFAEVLAPGEAREMDAAE